MASLFINKFKSLFLLNSIRRLSSFNNRTKAGIISIAPNEDFNNIWSESNWSEFSKQFSNFRQFPLPGQVGVTLEEKIDSKKTTKNIAEPRKACESLNFLLNNPLTHENQIIKLKEAAGGLYYTDKMEENLTKKSQPKAILELKAYQCPKSLMNDFQNYFRLNSIGETPLTVITVSFKTENDMATWTSQVDAEREVLTQQFVETAQEVCKNFEEEGFWADFIDPTSGRLFNSPYTHAVFYETDERYQKLGFEIVDYGCCKVISHHEWGTKAYVGCILTNASLNGKCVKETIKKVSL